MFIIILNYQIFFNYISEVEKYKNFDFDVFGGPFFNSIMSPDVFGVLGEDVRLVCHVAKLGNKTVIFTEI